MARFHGGADVTMPAMAGLEVHGDPYVKELDAIADQVAKRVFGTDLAVAHRWGRALGYINQDPVDTRSAPERVGEAHPTDHVSDFVACLGAYQQFYNEIRTRLLLKKDAPIPLPTTTEAALPRNLRRFVRAYNWQVISPRAKSKNFMHN